MKKLVKFEFSIYVGKLFTPLTPSSMIGTGQTAVILCIWEGDNAPDRKYW